MVAPGGPDEETWSKMSKSSRRNYWIFVIVFWLIFAGLLIKKYVFD